MQLFTIIKNTYYKITHLLISDELESSTIMVQLKMSTFLSKTIKVGIRPPPEGGRPRATPKSDGFIRKHKFTARESEVRIIS